MADNEPSVILSTNIARYEARAEDLTVRERLLLSLMRDNGRIEYSGGSLHVPGSYKFFWTFKKALPTVRNIGDTPTLTFDRNDLWQRANLDWRGYVATDRMDEREKLINRGVTALIKRAGTIIPNLRQAVSETMAEDFLIDGYSSGNEQRLCGAASWDGHTVSPAAGDLIAVPDDTYAGVDTDPGLEGSWSSNLSTYPNTALATDWPEGQATAGTAGTYDKWSPILAKTDSTGWTGTGTWLSCCEECLSRTQQWLRMLSGVGGNDTLYAMMAGEMFSTFKRAMRSKQQILVPHKRAQDLGFDSTLEFESMILQPAYEVTANTTYIFNVNKMRLVSLAKKLLSITGPTFQHSNLSDLYSCRLWAQLIFDSPKYFAKLYPFA